MENLLTAVLAGLGAGTVVHLLGHVLNNKARNHYRDLSAKAIALELKLDAMRIEMERLKDLIIKYDIPVNETARDTDWHILATEDGLVEGIDSADTSKGINESTFEYSWQNGAVVRKVIQRPAGNWQKIELDGSCLLYTSPSPRD